MSEEASITANTKMTSNSSQVAHHFELEANQKMKVFELDGANCAYDQDEWLGLHVWELFIKAKFIESNPEAGLSPGAAELSRRFSKKFNFTDAINHIVEANPTLKISFHQAGKPTLLRALGLAARSMSLSPEQIIARLSLFYQHEQITPSRETDTAAISCYSIPQSESNNGGPQLGEAHANTEQTYEDHMYTSALKEMGDTEGVSPTYTLNRLSLEPSKWGATAQYKQFKSFSEGSSKRAAKHSASKALWLKLGKSTIL